MLKGATFFAIAFCVLTVNAQTDEICEKRISAYSKGLASAIKANANTELAQEKLDAIHNLPANMGPCEKIKHIPELANSDEALDFALEAVRK